MVLFRFNKLFLYTISAVFLLFIFYFYSLWLQCEKSGSLVVSVANNLTEAHALEVANLRFSSIIFVGGFPRSGTTLFRAILDAHPDVRCGQETHIIPDILETANSYMDGSRTNVQLQLAGINSKLLNNALSSFLSEIIMGHGIPAKIYCNKDPFILLYAKHLATIYENSKFILMLRDGRAATYSAHSRNVTIAEFSQTNFTSFIIKWSQAAGNMYNNCYHLGVKRCLPVWYEHLVMYPTKVLPIVLKFLNLSWNDAVLHHQNYINKLGGTKLSKAEKSTDQVKKAIYLKSLKPFVGNVPSDLTGNRLNSLVPTINRLGYDTSNDPDYSKINIPEPYSAIYKGVTG